MIMIGSHSLPFHCHYLPSTCHSFPFIVTYSHSFHSFPSIATHSLPFISTHSSISTHCHSFAITHCCSLITIHCHSMPLIHFQSLPLIATHCHSLIFFHCHSLPSTCQERSLFLPTSWFSAFPLRCGSPGDSGLVIFFLLEHNVRWDGCKYYLKLKLKLKNINF